MSCEGCNNGECRDRERAALCATCIRGARRGGRTVGCGHAGEPVMLYMSAARPCPLGKHPDRRGVTRWAFLAWHGVPMPLRWWLWLRAPSHPRPSTFGACGCVVALKRVSDAIGPIILAAARGRRRGIVTKGALSHG